MEKLFNNYEAKLSDQMVKSLGRSIINMYLMGVCAVLRISDQDALSEDLENDPFLNSALQRVTCELYYRFGLFLAPLSVGIITSRHYLWGRSMERGPCGTFANLGPQGPSEHSKNGGTSETEENKNLLTSSEYEGLAAAILAAELMIGFWFGVGVVLAVKTLESLEYCIRRKY